MDRCFEKLSKKVIIGGPVRQKPEILKEFLGSLLSLEANDLVLDFIFIEDNEFEESKVLLKEFKPAGKVNIIEANSSENYLCNEDAHHWSEQLVWKIASFKDTIIDFAIENNYDYLFFADSDLILHPKTITHLISTEKDLISEVFWTKWKSGSKLIPQVWVSDVYSFVPPENVTKASENDVIYYENNFIEKMKTPGIYPVGGLGACTLISQKALLSGVSFKKIKNLTFWGEDRHFCVRAAILDFELYADTFYPPFHLYRESDLKKIPIYKEFWKKNNPDTRELIETIFDLSQEKELFLQILDYINNNDFEKANSMLSELIKSDKDGAYLYYYGFTQLKLEQPKEAINNLSASLQKNFEKKYELFYLIASCLEKIGQSGIAQAYYKKAEDFKIANPNYQLTEMI